MIYGLAGGPIPQGLKYGAEIAAACGIAFPPCLAYAIALRETIRGELSGQWIAATVESGDGGRGLFQLTSSWPPAWTDPAANARYAVDHFLVPSLHYFAGTGLVGDKLADAVADAFNAGTGTVESYLTRGINPDHVTTGGDYGADVVATYHRLLAGEPG